MILIAHIHSLSTIDRATDSRAHREQSIPILSPKFLSPNAQYYDLERHGVAGLAIYQTGLRPDRDATKSG
jgi:hypothetical protein